MSLLKHEWQKIIDASSFYIYLAFGMVLSFVGFLQAGLFSWGQDYTQVFSAYIQWFPFGVNSIVVSGLFGFFFIPTVIPYVCNDIYFQEINLRIYPILYCRSPKTTYIISKISASFFASCILVGSPLLFNLLLCLIAFPTNALTNPAWESTFMVNRYYQHLIGGRIFLNHPFLYFALFILIDILYAWTMGILSMLLTLKGIRNRIIVISTPLVMNLVCGVILQSIGLEEFFILNYLLPTAMQLQIATPFVLLFSLLTIFIFAMIVINRIYRDEMR